MRAGGRGPDMRTRDRGPDNPNTRCFEHIAGGVNIYLYVSISLLVCVCVCVCVCVLCMCYLCLGYQIRVLTTHSICDKPPVNLTFYYIKHKGSASAVLQ